MSRKAMQVALEALNRAKPACFADTTITAIDDAITALRQALETEQEPVAWISEGGDVSRSKRYMDEMGFKCNPLYTTPPQRKHNNGVIAERQRIVNLLMIQHEAAKGAHNYWHVAAQLIQADVASDT